MPAVADFTDTVGENVVPAYKLPVITATVIGEAGAGLMVGAYDILMFAGREVGHGYRGEEFETASTGG